MTDKKPTKTTRSIPKARLLVEIERVNLDYSLDTSRPIGELLSAIEKAIVDEQVAALS